ncbi:hypothetical protein [Methanoregula sp.]|uniref:hypothetical protein n=1 Tax=Methanoregula sp. TaxID=2052170 RepID=UPI003BAE4331
MTLDFCTRTTRKIRKLGYEKKVARRIAKFCYLSMTFTCGLFGLFERQKAPIYLITGFGIHAAGARAGTVSPALSLIRR